MTFCYRVNIYLNMRNNKIIIFFLFVLIGITPQNHVNAQGEANNWLIPINYLISFNSGEPELITPPPPTECIPFTSWASGTCDFFYSGYCGTSISSRDGDLLLYSNGEVIWNSEFDTILNGGNIYGDINSTQCLFIPKPGNTNRYYLITTPWLNTNWGARYTEIDITLDGGLGGALFPMNNVLLSNTCQKVTAVYHANGKDIWLMLHEFNTNAFYAYLVTSSGISNNPVITNIGTIHENPVPYTVGLHGSYGEMKFSTNGNKLAVAVFGQHKFELFDFNRSTGVLSNPVSLSIYRAKTVEFSSNSTLAYVGSDNESLGTNDTTSIFQFDLLAGDSIDIVNSKIQVDINEPDCSSARNQLQLAPDGKIYNTQHFSQWITQPPCTMNFLLNYLSIIQESNAVGVSCNWTFGTFIIPELYIGNTPLLMLPNFFRSALDRNIVFSNTCFGDSTLICTQTNTSFDSIRWEFEDVVAGLSFSIPNQDTIFHIFSEPESYEITLKRYRNGYLDEDKKMLYILPVVDLSLGPDTTICENSGFGIQLNDPYIDYAWVNDFSTDTIFNNPALINHEGNWWPVVTNFDEYCGEIDSIYISLYPDLLNLGNDTSGICISNPLTLDATLDSTLSAAEAWSTGDTTATIIATESNYYYVQVSQGFCTFYDTIEVTYDVPLNIVLQDTLILCDSIPKALSVGDIVADFLWSPTGETTPEIMVNTPGIYSVTASNGCGDFIDSTEVISMLSPTINIGNDTIICFGESLLLIPQITGEGELIWSTNETTNEIFISEEGEYSVSIENECGESADTIYLSVDVNDFAFTSDTIFISGGDSCLLSGVEGYSSYTWSTGDTTQTITVSQTGTYCLTVIDSVGCEATDSIVVARPYNVSSLSFLENIKIYPNPVTDELIIEGLTGNEEITVRDLLGRETLFEVVNNEPLNINLSDLSKGVYIITIKLKSDSKVFKILKE